MFAYGRWLHRVSFEASPSAGSPNRLARYYKVKFAFSNHSVPTRSTTGCTNLSMCIHLNELQTAHRYKYIYIGTHLPEIYVTWKSISCSDCTRTYTRINTVFFWHNTANISELYYAKPHSKTSVKLHNTEAHKAKQKLNKRVLKWECATYDHEHVSCVQPSNISK